ncbi:unnamed protein product, partial [Diamesa hyperborea]
ELDLLNEQKECSKCNNSGHDSEDCKMKSNYIKPKYDNYIQREINNISISRFCTYCNMTNHYTKDCGIKKRKNKNITSNKNYIQKEINNINISRFCSYCKMKNHFTKECGKLNKTNKNSYIKRKNFKYEHILKSISKFTHGAYKVIPVNNKTFYSYDDYVGEVQHNM